MACTLCPYEVSNEHDIVLLVSGSQSVNAEVISEITVSERDTTYTASSTMSYQKLVLSKRYPCALRGNVYCINSSANFTFDHCDHQTITFDFVGWRKIMWNDTGQGRSKRDGHGARARPGGIQFSLDKMAFCQTLTLAGTGKGVDATPLRFFWNIFFIYWSNATIFSIAFPPSFLRPPWKFQDPDPLTFDLRRHNWGHVRRKMRSVAHNLQTSPYLLVIWMWTCSIK